MSIDIDHGLRKEGYGQFTSTTCWFASYRMLYAWKKEDEKQIKPKIEGWGLNWQQLTQRGLLENELPKACGALGLVGWRGEWIKSLDDPGMITHLLKGYGPLFCAIDQGDSENFTGHAVVMGGYQSSNDAFKIYNPYNRFEPGTVEIDWWTFKHFKKIIHDSRFVVQAWP